MSSFTAVPKFNQKLLGPLAIDPDRTMESIESRKLENRLLIELNSVLLQIQRNIKFDIGNYKMQFDKSKSTLKQTVYDIIRSYYQQAYQLGTDYVNKALGTSSYLTESDIEHIKLQTENFANRFWGRLEKMLEQSAANAITALFDTGFIASFNHMEDQVEYFAKRISQTKSYLYSSLAILIITDALNSSVIHKSKAIHNSLLQQVPSNTLGAAVTLAETSFQTMDVEMIRLMTILNTLRYRWYTAADDRVCRRCLSLEGKTWSIGLNIGFGDIPIPPDSTHYNCRCRLFLEADL